MPSPAQASSHPPPPSLPPHEADGHPGVGPAGRGRHSPARPGRGPVPGGSLEEDGPPRDPTTAPARPLGLLARLTPATLAAVTLFASVASQSLTRRLADPDLWWHLRTGRLVAEQGSIPRVDPFSFTAAGSPWVAHEWGSELLLHWVTSGFGLRGLMVFQALLLIAFYALVARLLVREAGHHLGTWALVAAVAFAGAGNWTTRPNLFSFLLFALTLALVRRADRTVWWFVPLAAVWSNLHGMVLLGLGLVSLVAASEGLKSVLRWEGADGRGARRLGIVAGLGFVATLLNPHGLGLHTNSFRLMGLGRYVSEFASPSFHEIEPILFLGLTLLAIAGLALSPRRPDPTDVALAGAFLTLGLLAVRNITVAAVVMGLLAARHLPGALRAGAGRWAPRAASGVRPGAAAALGLTALLLPLVVLALPVVLQFPRSGSLDQVAAPSYPVRTLRSLPGSGVRLHTYYHWGGLALYMGWPGVHVSMDSRADMYGEALLLSHASHTAGDPGWKEWLEGACVTHVLLDERSGMARALAGEPGWTLVASEELPAGRAALFAASRLGQDCPGAGRR